ncbi:hypothetical protein Ddc_13969 [Ditylenchus destructor]|nr:hypothetical protein Ddc_13969 [Ditylenchus destructor]
MRIILIALVSSLSIFFILTTLREDDSTTLHEMAIPEPNKLEGASGIKLDKSLLKTLDSAEFPLRIIRTGNERDSESNTNGIKRTKLKNDLGACRIPRLEQNRAEVIKFMKKASPLKCSDKNVPDWLHVDNERKMQLTDYAKEHVAVPKLTCTWQFYERVSDNELKWYAKVPFKVGEQVTIGDFFVANCEDGDNSWTGNFMTIVPNKAKIEELQQVKRDDDWSGLNVYILGFDSLSQMSFRRNLPKTTEYLENVMNASVFNGYNIVGDGTPQAYIPILTGQTEEELPLTRKRFKTAKFVDDVYPFVWKNFSDAGYATLYGEDAHNIGTFTYRLKGFRQQPTDHYTPTFFQQLEKVCGGGCQCVGSTPQHKVWLDYAERFWTEYNSVPRFLLLHHSSLSHDDINLVQVADLDLRDHLKRQLESGAFDNTMVVVMADHGHRFASLRETHQGQLEERLPFFSVFLPSNVRSNPRFKSAIENIRLNSRDRLSSPFDLHPTLLDIIRLPKPETMETPHSAGANVRSMSMFREIPQSRNCAEAGIEPHWCTCLAWRSAMGNNDAKPDKDLVLSLQLAKAVVQVINDQTEPERKLCARLKLDQLIDAKKLAPNENLLKYNGVLDKDGFKPKLEGKTQTTKATYQIVLVTTPGNAKYEATVIYDTSGSERTVTVDLTAISHINKYGDSPHCIIDKNYFLAAYCVCHDKV